MKTAREAHGYATTLGVAKHIRKAIKRAAKSGLFQVELWDTVLEPFSRQDLQNLEMLGYTVCTSSKNAYWRLIKWQCPTK